MSISCPECAAAMPDAAAYCPGCGRAMAPVERARGTVGAFPVTLAGALAYCTIIPAIVFILVEPYRKDRFVRFHSFQSLGLFLVAVVVGSALRVAGFVFFFIPGFGPSDRLVALHSGGPGVVRYLGRTYREGAAGRDVQASSGGRVRATASRRLLGFRTLPHELEGRS